MGHYYITWDLSSRMKVLCSLFLILALVSLSQSYGGLSQKGCAYHVLENGPIFGRCDLDNSFCSYGCQKGYCWKQCLNKEAECVVNHRGYSLAVDQQGSYIKCQTEQDCLDKNLDFKSDRKCY